MSRAGTGIGILQNSSSYQRKPSRCTSSTSWKNSGPAIARRRLRSPYAAESSNCEKPSRLTSEHTTIVVLKNAEPWGFALPLLSLPLFVACSKVQTHTKETRAATLVFHVSRRVARRWPAAAEGRDRYYNDHSRRTISC